MKYPHSKISQKTWIIAFIGYFMILLTIMLLADLGMLPLKFLAQIPYYDKIGHIILYGIASFLCHRATAKKMMAIFHYPIPLGPFIFSIFTIAEEMLQAILPHRTASVEDLLCSMLGIILFYWVGEIWDVKNNTKF